MKSCVLLLCCLPFVLFAQTEINLGRTDDNQLQDNLKIEINQLRSYIYEDIPEGLKGELSERSMYRFADASAFTASNVLLSGSVYNGWRQADLYLNAVLQKILPEELKGKPYLKAYLLKEGNYNAFMTPSGQLFLNVGIFDEIGSESSLAGILSHEVAHYVLRHSVEGFIKNVQGDFKSGFLFRNEGAASKFSVENELQADSLAAVYMRAAGYDTAGLLEAFEVFRLLEENELLRQKYQWEIKETTHPSSEKRISLFGSLETTTDGESAAKYIISEGAFQRIKENAKVEILKYLLDDFDYYTCLEKAFKYHLYDPYNPTFIYYAMESIRRSCYLNDDLWDEKFFIHRYFEVVEDGGEREKIAIKTHFFDTYRASLLGLSEDSYDDIAAKFYWEEDVKFITNREAFAFFFQVSELLDQPECLLSYALSQTSEETATRDSFLQKYLQYENILHEEFAQSLLEDRIFSDLRDHKLSVFDKFITVLRQGKYQVLIWEELGKEGELLVDTVQQAVMSFPERNFLYLPNLKVHHLNDYLALQELERFSTSLLISKGKKAALYILDPAYWELLKKYNVNEIEFLNCIYRDVVKSDASVEGYQKVANSTHHDYLQLEKRVGRHLNIFLTSVKIKEEEDMKMRYYDGEDRLEYKTSGYYQVRELMVQKIINSDTYEKE